MTDTPIDREAVKRLAETLETHNGWELDSQIRWTSEAADTLRALLTAKETAEAERSDALKMAAENRRWLGEILAVIHGDGGHHLDENGPEVSTKEALEKWYDRLAQVEAAEAKLAVAVEGLEYIIGGEMEEPDVASSARATLAQINKETEDE